MSRELNVDLQVSFTLNLQQFYLIQETWQFVYNLKNIPMNALEAKYNTGWFGWIQS